MGDGQIFCGLLKISELYGVQRYKIQRKFLRIVLFFRYIDDDYDIIFYELNQNKQHRLLGFCSGGSRAAKIASSNTFFKPFCNLTKKKSLVKIILIRSKNPITVYITRHYTYSYVSNTRGGSIKRVGWNFSSNLIKPVGSNNSGEGGKFFIWVGEKQGGWQFS